MHNFFEGLKEIGQPSVLISIQLLLFLWFKMSTYTIRFKSYIISLTTPCTYYTSEFNDSILYQKDKGTINFKGNFFQFNYIAMTIIKNHNNCP